MWTGKVKSGWFGKLYAERRVRVPDPDPTKNLSKRLWVRVNLSMLRQIIDETNRAWHEVASLQAEPIAPRESQQIEVEEIAHIADKFDPDIPPFDASKYPDAAIQPDQPWPRSKD